jgi:carboxymethylenebutenolidase
MRVFLCAPEGRGPFPAVVVAQHITGVDDVIQKLAQRLSEAGFVTAAPDLYHRQKDNMLEEAMKVPPGPERLAKLGPKGAAMRDTEIIADVNATVAYLQGLPQVQRDRIGITGFCSGGRTTYLMASANPAVKAAAVYYGGNILRALGEGSSPFERTAQVSCPVIGFFGQEDQNPSPEDVKKIDAELTKYNKPHEFHSYPNAGHAFISSTGAAYREHAANDAWARMLAFFYRHLGVPTGAPAGVPR